MNGQKNYRIIKQPTLQDIAKACNVSVSTVSRVINKTGQIKESTAKKILQVAQEMNYAPNALARGIVTNQTNHMVGFLVPNISNPFFAEVVNYVENILSDHGYILSLCLFGDDPVKLSKFLQILTQSRASGIIVGSCREDSCKEDFAIAKTYMPIVSMQGDVDNVDRVDVTDEEGTYEIIQYLIDKGHRKIGFIGYRYDMSILYNRLQGYKRALQDNHIPINPEYICDGRHSYESGYEMASYLLELEDRPTAIHCFNEYMAQAAFDSIRDHHLKIPQDISLTGFDNIYIGRTLEPKLTTVSESMETMSKIAVDMLLARIQNQSTEEPQHIFIRHKLIIRDSVAAI